QASDFARSQRQEMIIKAIKQKATSVNAIANAPSIMDAVSKDMSTNLTLTDLKAIYDWSQHVNATQAVRTVSVDTSNYVDVCGNYYLCPNSAGDSFSQNFTELHHYFSSILVPPSLQAAKVPVQVLNGSVSLDSMGPQVTSGLQMEGFTTVAPLRVRPAQTSTVYNDGGSKAAATAQWMSNYFGAKVVSGPPPGIRGTQPGAVVVELGHDFSLQWVGENG
ncbi:MAG: LCP family protein, partial [Candidatus Dormibacteraeota bacterium]|nr:LCP family protein [Candidatus Dormibacteraeota bacterium]